MEKEVKEEMFFNPETNEFRVVMCNEETKVTVTYTWREYMSHTWECVKGLFKAAFFKIRIYF